MALALRRAPYPLESLKLFSSLPDRKSMDILIEVLVSYNKSVT